MASDDARHWALAVRVLTVVSALLFVVVVLEAHTVRQARAELQQLRSERDRAKSQTRGEWAHQSLSEIDDALRWLDGFYAEPNEGFGRPGGLCANGSLADRAITSYLIGGFLSARAAGASYDASVRAMRSLIVKSDEYRGVHPGLASPQGR